ncbi:MAG: hypothetical protein ACRD4B_01615, partial [Acidobacteriota bacterium]
DLLKKQGSPELISPKIVNLKKRNERLQRSELLLYLVGSPNLRTVIFSPRIIRLSFKWLQKNSPVQ